MTGHLEKHALESLRDEWRPVTHFGKLSYETQRVMSRLASKGLCEEKTSPGAWSNNFRPQTMYRRKK